MMAKESTNQFHRLLINCIERGKNKETKEMLKNVNTLSNLVDSSGKSLLHWAVLFGNEEITEYLIGRNYDVDAQDNDGNTPLMIAVEADKEYLIEILIKVNTNVHISNKNCTSPVQIVLSTWNLSGRGVVRLFLDKLRDEFVNDKQKLVNELINLKCPIYFVVLLRDVEITRMMLDRGCSLKARCPKIHDTALHEAVTQSDLANVRLLIKRGAFINEIGYKNEPPLCRYNVFKKDTYEKLEVLKFLIANGTLLYHPKKKPPLERLFEKGNKETLCTLVQIDGIDLRKEYREKKTALHLICVNESLDAADAILLFQGKDFNVNACDTNGWTALMIAASKRCVKKVEYLIDMDANVNIINSYGNNALYETLRGEYRSLHETPGSCATTINLLVQCGINVLQYQCKSREHVLQHVVMENNFHLAEIVLARLAQLEVLGEFGILNSIRHYIALDKQYNEYYVSCLKHLEEMKKIEIYESMTVLDLLNESTQHVKHTVCNEIFLSKCNDVMTKQYNFIPHYYSSAIRRLLVDAIKRAKLEDKATGVICKLIDLADGHIVANKIVDYLNLQDLINLIEISKII